MAASRRDSETAWPPELIRPQTIVCGHGYGDHDEVGLRGCLRPGGKTRDCVRDSSELEEDRREAGAGKFEMSKPLLSFLVSTACDRARERTNVITGDGQPEVTMMDFSA